MLIFFFRPSFLRHFEFDIVVNRHLCLSTFLCQHFTVDISTPNQLEKDIAEVEQNQQILLKEKRLLETRKDYLEQHIYETRLRLEEQLNLIVSVIHTTPGANKRIYPKNYNTNGRWMWLPGRAYDVIEKFDELGECTKDVICSLRKDLHKIGARYDHTSTNVVQQ